MIDIAINIIVYCMAAMLTICTIVFGLACFVAVRRLLRGDFK